MERVPLCSFLIDLPSNLSLHMNETRNNALFAFLAVVTILLLQSCALEPTTVNPRRSGLMPEAAAVAILQKHLGDAWVKQPQGWTAPICGQELRNFNLRDVTTVGYWDKVSDDLSFTRQQGVLIIAGSGLCGRVEALFEGRSATAVQEIADALAALGAKLQ
jgi:hypothetical protein